MPAVRASTILRRAPRAIGVLAAAKFRLRPLRDAAGRALAAEHRVALAAGGCPGGRGDQALAAAALAGLGAAALALSWRSSGLRCDGAAAAGVGEVDVRVATYNLLSPPLAAPSHFPQCAPEDVDHRQRFPKICARLEQEVAAGAVIGLQEVDLGWAGQLHAFFAERGYVAVFAQYGKPMNGYMGVMIAWPTASFEVQDVEISRLSDTAPKQMWPKKKAPAPLNPYGFLTKQGLRDILGFYPPDVGQNSGMDPGSFEWNLARDRFNEVIFVRLRPRGSKSGQAFVVSTYHMPCLFGSPEKVRVVNIHSYLLLSRLRAFAAGDPAILMGDFNIKPGTSPYCLLASGGSLAAAASAPGGPEEVLGLGERLGDLPWPEGLESAYRRFHGKEPLFTNFAQTKGMSEPFVETLDYIWYTPGRLSVVACPGLPECREAAAGPFPNKQEPSDHVLLEATLRLAAAAA